MDIPLQEEYASQLEDQQGADTTTDGTSLEDNYDNNNGIIFSDRNENTPNMKYIIDRLAEQCPVIMQSAWDASRPGWGRDLRFLDLVVEALRAEDQRWGYTFWTRTGYADSWAVDRVGYFHGTGDPYNSTDMTVIDHLTARQESEEWTVYTAWTNITQQLKTEYPDATGYWRYPRPGTTVSLSDCSESGDGACSSSQREPHYKEVNGQCLPSCGHAANMAGYGGRGLDNQTRTSDDRHVYGSNVSSCANLERFGHSDWRNFSWTDRRTSKTMNNSKIYEVVENGGVCCVRGDPTTRTTPIIPTTRTTPIIPTNPIIPTTPITSTTLPNVGLTRRSDNPPNMLPVVKRMANNHRQVMLDSCRKGHETLDFLDLVLTELRKENEGIRWGFNCKRGDCNHLSIDAIAYYRGTGNPNNSSDVAIFDIIASCHSDSPQPAWSDVTQATKDAGAIGRYKYPR